MASTIKLKNGSGAPTTGDLVQGEPALDLTNKRLYTENASGVVIEVGTNPSTIDINAGTIDGTVIGGSTAAAITGTTITGTSFVSSGDMTFGDSDKAIFGAGSDLQIYHSGSQNYIEDAGTGNLNFKSNGNNFNFLDGSDNVVMQIDIDSATTLYHNTSAKLATTATGIDVTGTVTADGLTSVVSSSGATTTSASLYNNGAGSNTKTGIDFYAASSKYATIAGGFGAASPEVDILLGSGTQLKAATFSGGGDVRFYEDTGTTTKFFWDASEERLGIGTSIPASALVINQTGTGGQNTTILLESNTVDVGSVSIDPTSSKGLVLTSIGSFPMAFNTNGSERMRISSSGNVGIGTSSPTSYASNCLHLNSASSSISLRLTNSTTGSTVSDGSDIEVDGSTLNIVNRESGNIALYTSATERARIDSSGNLLVGKTATNSATAGAEVRATGALLSAVTSNFCGFFNRISTDGTIIEFAKNDTTVGSIGTSGGDLVIEATTTGVLKTAGSGSYGWNNSFIYPIVDDSKDLGTASFRFDDIYATNGTIQTSDRNEKQDIEVLSDAEQRVAVACKGLLRKFRWKSKVEEKGDDARIHFGIIAQDLQAAFEAEGLDAGRYAMFISSTWTDEETGEERSRMGVRYSELLAFIIAAI